MINTSMFSNLLNPPAKLETSSKDGETDLGEDGSTRPQRDRIGDKTRRGIGKK